ncbi:hypothetical protein BC828DRAFT_69842 [Blastocladiella britannica]|nr:hypothetical protein BC828DRAFT_69842 [Blastocladiella britannica]
MSTFFFSSLLCVSSSFSPSCFLSILLCDYCLSCKPRLRSHLAELGEMLQFNYIFCCDFLLFQPSTTNILSAAEEKRMPIERYIADKHKYIKRNDDHHAK